MALDQGNRKTAIETVLKLFEGRPELLSGLHPSQAVDALIAGAEKIGTYVVHGTTEPQSKD